MLPPAQVGILGGTGQEGRALALRLGAVVVPTLLGSRRLDRAREIAGRIGEGTRLPVEGASNDEVLERCDLVFLAVPFAHAASVVETYSGRFRPDTVLVDLTVPVTFEGGEPALVELPEGSAAEHLRARLDPRIGLAAALKTIPASVLGRVDESLGCDGFVCGDPPWARAAVLDVLGRIPGLRPVDAGNLEAARTLERMAVLAIALNKRFRVRSARYRVVGLGDPRAGDRH